MKQWIALLLLGSVISCGDGSDVIVEEQSTLATSNYVDRQYLKDSNLISPVKIEASYDYQKAQPVVVNGKEVLRYKYWSCLKSVTLTFNSPVSVTSLQGQVSAVGKYRSDSPLHMKKIHPGFYKYEFAPTQDGKICDRQFPYQQIALGSLIRGMSQQEFQAGRFDLNFLPPSQVFSAKVTNENPAYQPSGLRGEASSSWEAETVTSDYGNCGSVKSSYCLVNLVPSRSINTRRVSNAYQKIFAWRDMEARRSTYRREAIARIMKSDTLLVERGASNLKHHFGFPDLRYNVRRAAKFMEWLFPEMDSISLADMARADGETPYTEWFDGSRYYLHPEGSHTGKDVDFSYIFTGTSGDRKTIDIEKSFWLLYSLLETVGVDLVFTAYKEEFVQYGEQAVIKGLINPIALARFKSARVIQDDNLSHDSHMHIRISYLDNDSQTLRFKPMDNAYNCLLGIHEQGVSANNYCM